MNTTGTNPNRGFRLTILKCIGRGFRAAGILLLLLALNAPRSITHSSPTVTAVSAGDAHTLVLESDGSLWAMGHNNHGRLDNGTMNDLFFPTKIVSSNVVAVAAGGDRSLVPTSRDSSDCNSCKSSDDQKTMKSNSENRNRKPDNSAHRKAIFLFLTNSLVAFSASAAPIILPVTYQGRLLDGATAANGQYEVRFGLFNAATGGTELAATTNAVSATNGLFTTVLNLDRDMFPDPDGSPRWMEIGVRTNGSAVPFSPLNARQELTFSPYAIRASVATLAENLPASSIAGFNIQSATITAGKIAAGEVVKSLNGLHDAVTLAAGTNTTVTPSGNTLTISGTMDWHLGGNAGTTAGTDFIGTTDSQPLEFRVQGGRALRLEPNANGIPNVIGGAAANYVSNGITGATIGGGGARSLFGLFVSSNSVAGNFGTVSGGANNVAGSDGGTVGGGGGNNAEANYSTVGGGGGNDAGAAYATVAGGLNNIAGGVYATVAGGQANRATNSEATVGGGNLNVAGGLQATVGGGYLNSATGNGATIAGGNQNSASGVNAAIAGGNQNIASGYIATVGGGIGNVASGAESFVAGGAYNDAVGDNSLAGGRNAQANHDGTFVWADFENSAFASTTTNEFSIRSQNGVRIQTDKGIHLNAADEPIIVRDWDVFAANAGAAKAGIGRWGLFMEANHLTAGIPAIPAKSFQVAKYETNGVATQLMQVDQSGNVTATGAINGSSDRNAKENFKPVSPSEVLEKVAALPISEWNYKQDKATPHIGPMAQDFHAAFSVGPDDRHISTVDADGVALAAIQGLNQKLEQKEKEIAELKARLERLEELLDVTKETQK